MYESPILKYDPMLEVIRKNMRSGIFILYFKPVRLRGSQ